MLGMLYLSSCRLFEGEIDRNVGNLRSGSRAEHIQSTVKGLSVALSPDPGDLLSEEGDRLQNLSVREADMKDVLLTFFADSDLNLLFDPGIGGSLTFDFKNTTVSEAFLSILDSNGLGFARDGDFMRIAQRETRIYQINYMSGGLAADSAAAWKTIIEEVRGLTSGTDATVVSNQGAGTIAVTDRTANLQKIERYLDKLQEIIGRQVMIEAMLFEVALSDTYLTGINYSLLPGYFNSGHTGALPDAFNSEGMDTNMVSFPNSGTSEGNGIKIGFTDADDYSVLISALQTQGQVRVLSAPRVMTLNNVAANINLVEKVPVINQEIITAGTGIVTKQTISFTDAGISITVTPQVSDNGEIWANIKPSVTEVAGTVRTSDGGAQAPILNTRNTDATLHVRNGQSIILGGIRSIRKNESSSGVPILMDIPFLGNLFRSNQHEKSETELVIMMTPTVIESEAIPELVRDGLSRVERLAYPFYWGSLNMNNDEDQRVPYPKIDQANFEVKTVESAGEKAEKTITRRGLALLYLRRGIQSFQEGRKLAAKSMFEKSMLFHSLKGEAELYLGLLAMNAGDRNLAKKHFDRRIAQNPNDPIALNNRGVLELLDSHPLIALPYLRKAVELFPENSHVHNNLGLAYVQLGQTEKAQQEFGAAMGNETGHAEANFNLARIYDAEGFDDAAAEHYEAFLDALPTSSIHQSQFAALRLVQLRKPQ